MARKTRIRRGGGSLVVALTGEIKALGLGAGDELIAIRVPGGVRLVRHDPDLAGALDHARSLMRRYPNAMEALAE
jgi:hypothetical protein